MSGKRAKMMKKTCEKSETNLLQKSYTLDIACFSL